jgi:hydroxymethylpyrimidine pyrophosphatase-like HAD family hydrolase
LLASAVLRITSLRLGRQEQEHIRLGGAMSTALLPLDVFFDLDGTLIDHTYRPNVDVAHFRNAVTALGPRTRIHLNSNRSIAQLRAFHRLFGLNGCIVLENGCCFVDPVSGTESISSVPEFDRGKLRAATDVSVRFVSTDEVVASSTLDCEDGDFIFAEQSRRYTMTLYPRQVAEKAVLKNAALLEKAFACAVGAFPDYDVTVDFEIYYNVLLKPKTALKSTLIPRLSAGGVVASFGDSRDDICMFECSTFCGAPANASQAARDGALASGGIVTSGAFTAGAIEFLTVLRARFR